MSKKQYVSPKKDAIQKNALVGFVSRIDYGSPGFRSALVGAAFRQFAASGTHFNVLAGGLVSKSHLTEQMKAFVRDGLAKIKAKSGKVNKQELTPSLEEEFLKAAAGELAKTIPTLYVPDSNGKDKQKAVDLFITTSPAFDGEIGERVARFLQDLRQDIKIWNTGGDRFPVLFVEKLVWVLTPVKGVWMRGDYYSTAAERVIKDKLKTTTQYMPDHFMVGCLASSIDKTKGELPFSYGTVPACCRLEEARVSDNQIGVVVLEFPTDGGRHIHRTYSFKDLVARELSFIGTPSKANSVQKTIIERTKVYGSTTPGLIQHHHPEISKEDVLEQMGKIAASDWKNNFPGMYYSEDSRKIYFDLAEIQRRLKYDGVKGPLQEDRIVSFCCLHAGSIETDYEFFVKRVPEIIVRHRAIRLVNAGDTKEGLQHDLDKTGQIIAGMNNTQQEKFAAHLIGGVMFKVFQAYFAELVAQNPKAKLSGDQVCQYVNASLMEYDYRMGNHDLWEARDGHQPLAVFHYTLSVFLLEKISEFLAGIGVRCEHLWKIIERKIVCTDAFSLPSGLKVSVQHPHMARAKTTSLRPQEMLNFARECPVVIGGNFHVGETVAEWDPTLGQRVCVELGTIKHGSDFERNKMKMVDQGVNYLGIYSAKSTDQRSGEETVRIVMTESAFYGEPRPRPPVRNLRIINDFITSLGVDPIKD